MSRKSYSEEFRRQAVELYESTPAATIRGIAADLGVVRGTLTGWIEQYGTGTKTHSDGTQIRTPTRPHTQQSSPGSEAETVEQKLARLEAENAALRAETTKLTTEREIVRKAAKYFASMPCWTGPVGFARYFAAPALGPVACPDVRSRRTPGGRPRGLIEVCR